MWWDTIVLMAGVRAATMGPLRVLVRVTGIRAGPNLAGPWREPVQLS